MEGAAGAGDDAEAPCERRLSFARVVPAEGAGLGRAGASPAGAGIPGLPGSIPAALRMPRARPAARSGREEAHPHGGGRVRPSGLRSLRRGAQAVPRASPAPPGVPPAACGGALRGVALVALPLG